MVPLDGPQPSPLSLGRTGAANPVRPNFACGFVTSSPTAMAAECPPQGRSISGQQVAVWCFAWAPSGACLRHERLLARGFAGPGLLVR